MTSSISTRVAVGGCIALTLVTATWTAHADVVLLDRNDFYAALGPGGGVIADFESLASGPQTTPMVLFNGIVFGGSQPRIIGTSSSGNQLFDNTSPILSRVFTGFAPNATLFGIDLALQDDDVYDIDVATTQSGTILVADEERGDRFNGFFGFRITGADQLLSVSFLAGSGTSGPGAGAGTGQYFFDNVAVDIASTASPTTSVPEPASALLALAGLGLLTAVLRVRRDRMWDSQRLG